MIETVRIIAGIGGGLIGTFVGIVLIRVGTGVWSFTGLKKLGFITNKRIGSPNVLEMLIGFFLVIASMTTVFVALSNKQPFGLDDRHFLLIIFAILNLALSIGYFKPLTLTVVKNTYRASIYSKISGFILLLITIALFSALHLSPSPSAIPAINNVNNAIARFNQEEITDMAKVSLPIPVLSGTYENIPDEYKLWIVAQLGGSTCYPMNGPAIRDKTGVWRHPEIRSLKVGASYFLSLVLADSKASIVLKSAMGKQSGFPCDHVKIMKLDTIYITVESE